VNVVAVPSAEAHGRVEPALQVTTGAVLVAVAGCCCCTSVCALVIISGLARRGIDRDVSVFKRTTESGGLTAGAGCLGLPHPRRHPVNNNPDPVAIQSARFALALMSAILVRIPVAVKVAGFDRGANEK
jgi:hypothetical protein